MPSLLPVIVSLLVVQLSLALYGVLTKAALNTGMDAGVFTIIRDGLCATCLAFMVRHRTGAFEFGPSDPADHASFIVLGTFGLYFGQYLPTLGVKYGTPLLSATWSNAVPLVTYVYGLILGVERFDMQRPALMKVTGLCIAVGGAVATTVATEQAPGNTSGLNHTGTSGAGSDPETNLPLASCFFLLQVLFGGAGFWHLQKRLLSKYPTIKVAAWYYGYGVVVLMMTILPHSTASSQWTFQHADGVALVYAVTLWPTLAFLLTYANANGSPVLVMAFAPLQIVAVSVLDFLIEGNIPSAMQMVASAVVVAGIACFLAGTVMELGAGESAAADGTLENGGDSDGGDGGGGGGGGGGGSGGSGGRARLHEAKRRKAAAGGAAEPLLPVVGPGPG
jgi:drug/metabolite transporter (DMT)-like permease